MPKLNRRYSMNRDVHYHAMKGIRDRITNDLHQKYDLVNNMGSDFHFHRRDLAKVSSYRVYNRFRYTLDIFDLKDVICFLPFLHGIHMDIFLG